MFKNYKSLELMRHHMLTKSKKVFYDHSQNESGGFNKLSEVVFSSALSLFLTYLAKFYFVDDKNIPLPVSKIIILFILAIIIYCVLFVTIRKLYSNISEKIAHIRYQKSIHAPETSAQRIKELVDDFDHIAFDNLIIAYEFLDEFKSNEHNVEITTFYFHESVYYLRTAINKTQEIVHPDVMKRCLNICGNANGVDVFRLINAHKIMCEILNRIEYEFNNSKSSYSLINTYNETLKESLKFQLTQIHRDVDIIGERCEEAKKQIKKINSENKTDE